MLKVILTLFFLLKSSQIAPVQADLPVGESFPVLKKTAAEVNVILTAESALAYDIESGVIIWSKNPDKKLPIASLTKLISGILLVEEKLDLSQTVVMKAEDQRPWGGNRHLYLGEELTIDQLFNAAFIASDNEAVMALVRAAGYTEEQFVEKMSFWLEENGFVDTKILDPTGLNPANTSTAGEMAKIALRAFSQHDLTKYLQKDFYQFSVKNSGREVKLKNTNELLNSQFDVKIGKTGYTEEAGYCFAASSKMPGREIITVVLGSQTKNDRFQDTKALIYWISNNFIW